MAKRAEEQENYWPGYVDALSTIVMVVTFLLIVLGIVIYVISQNIAKELLRAGQYKEISETKPLEQKTETATPPAVIQQQKKPDENDIKDDAPPEPESKTDKEKTIVVDSKDENADVRNIKVVSSQAILSLKFQRGLRITEDVSSEIKQFLQGNELFTNATRIEIRGFSNSDGRSSISEARRLAYYRALATRNELLSMGVDSGKISLKISPSSREEDRDTVKIYLQ